MNQVNICGIVKNELEKEIKDGINYGYLIIEYKSKYEMNPQAIKCTFAGPVLEKIENNIHKNDNIEIIAHLITEDNHIQVIVDEVNI